MRLLGAVVMRMPSKPFEGRDMIVALIKNFRVQALPVLGKPLPVCFESFEAAKKYVYIFSDEFEGERMGHLEISGRDAWARFCGGDWCWLIRDSDLKDVEVGEEFFATKYMKPFKDIEREEAIMTPYEIQKLKEKEE
jgi:hypothetical protein